MRENLLPPSEPELLRNKPLLSFAKSFLVTALLVGVLAAGGYSLAGPDLGGSSVHNGHPFIKSSDDPIELTAVPDKEISVAVDGMQLSAAAKEDLKADLAPTEQPSPSSIMPSAAPVPQVSTTDNNRIHLARITLWDLGVKEGDVIRISSQGYSRTIVLTDAPVTFAIPIPVNGTVTFTGVFDRNGTGITYGTYGWPLGSPITTKIVQHLDQGEVASRKVRVTQ